jgi:tripartite-type tricarboxylate transporter receptor subunit TctC
MNEDVNKVLAMADVQERLDNYGAEDGGGSSERFAEFIRKEIVLWRQVVKDGNVKGDT